MKRSPCISLVLLSTLSLTACDSDVSAIRSEYLTLEDCVRDWGEANECEERGDRYYGPEYYFDDDDHKHYFKSKKYGKVLPASSNPVFAKNLASNQSSAFSRTPVMVGGFGKSGSFHGISS